ncbi:DUF92 domain-containing protein [Chloropicon primus]|uniref:DUF92 domain-containing protein n=2 Tax=Chloropicon primus TaxID=1764295 RepID=A0A5B8MJP4_9CHLO|nr:DUF92 domain-containing protein [Chloropicon primus]UPQ99859.1 DUF92 domain-containing protein [Chloropicon primus]|eukprot:QDZ20647.1 DUF92 domain-containing protein [Chloropicon primus]
MVASPVAQASAGRAAGLESRGCRRKAPGRTRRTSRLTPRRRESRQRRKHVTPQLEELDRRRPSSATCGALPPLGQVLLTNSSVFLFGYPALRSGLSNLAIAHSWMLGTLVLAGFQAGGYVLVCAYFVFGTLVTKVGKKVKVEEGTFERNEGKRTPASVWGSGFAAAVCAVLALAFAGDEAVCRLLRVGFVASLATKLSDTVASEIGKACGRTTILITSLKPVPRGTDGAVSLEGTLAGLLASAAYAGLSWKLGQVNPLGACVCVIAAFLATGLESWIGATLQQESSILTNDVVNGLMISAGSLIAMATMKALT